VNKDWTGNKKSTFVTLGASNHSEGERETNDFYATDPHALEIFLDTIDKDNIKLNSNIWEPACGMGHLSKVLENNCYNVYSTDLVYRGYGIGNIDFLKTNKSNNFFEVFDIITNPPYKYAKDFVEHSLEVLEPGCLCIMLLKIQFLEGQERRKLFNKYPPKYVYVNSARQVCYINGDMSKKMSSATCFCWFIWEKGFVGEPVVRWI